MWFYYTGLTPHKDVTLQQPIATTNTAQVRPSTGQRHSDAVQQNLLNGFLGVGILLGFRKGFSGFSSVFSGF